MTKKDFEKAARIAQQWTRDVKRPGDDSGVDPFQAAAVVEAFVELFKDEPRFDEDRFRRACEPGANVKARG